MCSTSFEWRHSGFSSTILCGNKSNTWNSFLGHCWTSEILTATGNVVFILLWVAEEQCHIPLRMTLLMCRYPTHYSSLWRGLFPGYLEPIYVLLNGFKLFLLLCPAYLPHLHPVATQFRENAFTNHNITVSYWTEGDCSTDKQYSDSHSPPFSP